MTFWIPGRALWIATIMFCLIGGTHVSAHDTQKQIRIGVRYDSPPFAQGIDGRHYEEVEGYLAFDEFAGFAVDICKRIAANALKAGLYESTVVLPVDAGSRLPAIKDGKVDFLCDPTSITIDRLSVCSFSFPYFVSGVSYITQDAKYLSFGDLKDQRIGLVASTTAETRLEAEWLRRFARRPDILAAKTYEDAETDLASGKVAAVFGDRDMLEKLNEQPGRRYHISADFLSIELYAFCVKPDDQQILSIVNKTLAEIYRSGEILELVRKHFNGRQMSSTLIQIYGFYAVPEK